MKIAILGYGMEGQAAYDYWHEGNEVVVCDQNAAVAVPAGIKSQLGDGYLHGLEAFDLIVRSPFVKPSDIVAANGSKILKKVTSCTNEFLRVCPTKHVIGLTGTKGKGTTSTLITRLLEADGKRVHLGGNIGVAALDLLKNNIEFNDWVVLELSSFQLIDLKHAPHIGVCLMVVPEHLDWHPDINEYTEAKSQLFVHQTADDIAIYYAHNELSRLISAAGHGQKLPYFAVPGAVVKDGAIQIDGQTICQTNELQLLGKHNWQNVCAAVTAFWQISQNLEAARSVLTSFQGLPFRIEFRAEKHGIRYYNDSFAASPPAPVAAIEAIDGQKVVILGGFDRQLVLDELCKGISKNAASIRSLLLIGASAERLAEALHHHGFDHFKVSSAKAMKTIVQEATALAQSGDAVILSPGFSSFDMFKNFEDRGQQFNQAVEAL